MRDVIPVSEKRRTSYENFAAECPWCGQECIFNRASDLGTFKLITGRNVTCLNKRCNKTFRLLGDTVSAPHVMLVYDCYELLERKHYMNCILSLSQAYEMFFSLFLEVELLCKPFATDPDRNFNDLNRLSEKLGEKIKRHTFERMRALFLQQLIAGHSPANLGEAAEIIAAFPNNPKNPKDSKID